MNTFHKPLPLRGGDGGHMIDFKNVFISYMIRYQFSLERNDDVVFFYFAASCRHPEDFEC